MRVTSVFALVTVAGIAPSSLAFAGGHHGGGGPEVRDHRSSSSDSGSSGPIVRDHRSSSSDDSDSPRVRDHRSSHEDPHYPAYSDGTVYVENNSYGESYEPGPGPFSNYSGPAWTLELGGLAHRFRGPSLDRSGAVDNYGVMNSYTISSGEPSRGDTSAAAFDIRITVPTTQHLYLGAEVGIGGVTRSPVQLMEGGNDLTIGSRTMVDSAVVAGTRSRFGIAELGAELAGGVRVLSTTIRPIDADLNDDDSPSSTENAVSPLLEARLRAALWLSPHLFVAGQVGVSALDHDDVNVGFAVGISSSPFARHR